jgi:fluoroquinolone transport system permease protein
VQGFAMSKFTALAGMVIVFGYFASPGAQWFFGVFPPFWVSKAYWLMLEGSALSWAALAMAVITQVVAILFLAKLFRRAVYR